MAARCPSGKRKFTTWLRAMTVATGEGLVLPHAYCCPTCDHWHLTRQKQKMVNNQHEERKV